MAEAELNPSLGIFCSPGCLVYSKNAHCRSPGKKVALNLFHKCKVLLSNAFVR